MATVGGPGAIWAMALNPGANQYTGPAYSGKACFMVSGDITTTNNKGQVGRANEWSSYLVVAYD